MYSNIKKKRSQKRRRMTEYQILIVKILRFILKLVVRIERKKRTIEKNKKTAVTHKIFISLFVFPFKNQTPL